MMTRTAILRAIGLWAIAWLCAGLLGGAPALAHGGHGHHHEPARAAPASVPAPPAPVVVVAAPADIMACATEHGRMTHDACCTGLGCCTAGCTAAAMPAHGPGLGRGL